MVLLRTRISSLNNSPRIRSARKTPIVCRHLLNQDDRLRREPRLSRMRLRFALPEQTEELTMEAAEASPAGQGRSPVSRFGPSWPEVPGATGPSSGRPAA